MHMSSEFELLLMIAGSFLVLIISPGPNFLVISQISVNLSRLHGVATGIGVACGSITWATLAATGLGVVFREVPIIQPSVQVIGGCYLLYIAFNTLKSAGRQPQPRQLDREQTRTLASAWRFGYFTNMTNPKALAFYTSVFSLVTKASLEGWVRYAGVAIIAVMAISWFSLLATLFSIESVQSWYRGRKWWIDMITGVAMGFFGLRLIAGVLPLLFAQA